MKISQRSLVKAMGYHLMAQSSRLAFIQSRVSAEAFVRNECALAASNYLADKKFNVHMEKKFIDKKIDILIVPEDQDKAKEWKDPYIFELKMAWPGGLGECSGRVRNDIERLKDKKHAWIVVLFFAFSKTPDWLPFGKRKLDFEAGIKEFISRVDFQRPTYMGPRFNIGYADVEGEAQLIGWEVKRKA